MIFNEVNKSQVDNLYNDNLLVNLGSIKDSILHDYDDKPYGLDSYAFVKVLNGAINPIPSTVKPYFNCHYAYCSNPDKTLQIKLKVNDEWVDVGAIHGDTELSFTKSKLNIYFDKEFNGSSVVSKDNSLAFVFTSNIIPTLDNYEIYGLKLEAGLIPTKFETEIESRVLNIAKLMADKMIASELFYKIRNDITWSDNRPVGYGTIISSTQINIHIPLSKPVSDSVNTSSALLSGSLVVRGVSGYPYGGGINDNKLDLSANANTKVSAVTFRLVSNGIFLQLTLRDPLTNFTSNSPCTLMSSGTVKIELL